MRERKVECNGHCSCSGVHSARLPTLRLSARWSKFMENQAKRAYISAAAEKRNKKIWKWNCWKIAMAMAMGLALALALALPMAMAMTVCNCRARQECHEGKAQDVAGRSGELNELEMHLACMTLGMGKANGQEHSCCCSYWCYCCCCCCWQSLRPKNMLAPSLCLRPLMNCCHSPELLKFFQSINNQKSFLLYF